MKQAIRLLLLMSFVMSCFQTSCFAMNHDQNAVAAVGEQGVEESWLSEFLGNVLKKAYEHQGEIIIGGMALAIFFPEFVEMLMSELPSQRAAQELIRRGGDDLIDYFLHYCKTYMDPNSAEPLSMFLSRCLKEDWVLWYFDLK